MRADQSRFDEVVRAGDAAVRVRCRPRGSELRDLTDGIDAINWFSAVPGLLGLIGLALHCTVFRLRWFVEVQPLVPRGERIRRAGLKRREAERMYAELTAWIEDGQPASEFDGLRGVDTVAP